MNLMTKKKQKELHSICNRENYQGIVDDFYCEINRYRKALASLRKELALLQEEEEVTR